MRFKFPNFKMPNFNLPKDSTYWAAAGQIVGAVAALLMVVVGFMQLRMAYHEAAEQRKHEHERTRPYLALDQQYRGIEVEINEHKQLKRPKRNDPNDPVSTLMLRNYGQGPALNCKVAWHVHQINLMSKAAEQTGEVRVYESRLEPCNIMPGQESKVIGWPGCFEYWNQPEEKVAWDAQGYIVFTCERMDGTKEEFKETFDMTQGFGAKPHPLLKMHAWGKHFPWEDEMPAFYGVDKQAKK